jgi:hypothetical protein
MLPDLRIVIAAVLSTFVLSVGVGFYASSRMISETRKGTDSLAAHDETPVSRIALSWPEPTRQSEPLALDFAVTAKALRNPVRDVTQEKMSVPAPDQPVRTSATDLAVPARAHPAKAAPAPIEAIPVPEAVPATPPVVTSIAPEPAPEPDIRVAVQYPPVLELPEELRTPPAVLMPEVVAPETIAPEAITPAPVMREAVAVPAVAVPAVTETPSTTGTVTEQATSHESPEEPSSPAAVEPDTRLAALPEPAEAGTADLPAAEDVPLPKPAPTIGERKTAPKKAAPRRVVRRPVKRATPPVTNTIPNFFSLFTFQQPR